MKHWNQAYMLVNQKYRDIRSFMCKSVKSLFDCCCFGFGINDEKVLLRVWRLKNML